MIIALQIVLSKIVQLILEWGVAAIWLWGRCELMVITYYIYIWWSTTSGANDRSYENIVNGVVIVASGETSMVIT